MFSRLHRHVGTAGLIVAIVALIAALGGGAYAATGGSSSKATASAKAKQGKQGKQGKTGPAGPAGAVGPAGAQGPSGPKGDTGAAGSNGTNGTNGSNGTNGKTGFTATLPGGETETGVWAFGEVAAGAKPSLFPFGKLSYPISFTIPLAAGLASEECTTIEATPAPPHVAATCHVHYIDSTGQEVVNTIPVANPPETVASTACTGTVAEPSAAAGNLCVYEGSVEKAKSESSFIENANGAEENGTSAAGAVIRFWAIEEGAKGLGTWAVTAE